MKTWCIFCRFMRLAGECEHIRGRVYEPPAHLRGLAALKKAGTIARGREAQENVCSGGQQNVMAANVPKGKGDIAVPETFVGRTFVGLRNDGSKLPTFRIVKFNSDRHTFSWHYTDGSHVFNGYPFSSLQSDLASGRLREVTP